MARTLQLLFLTGCIAAFGGGCNQQSDSPEPRAAGVTTSSPDAAADAITRVRINFGDGSQWQFDTAGTFETVADLMRQVAAHPRAPKIVMTGEGTTAFIASIGGLDSSSGKGWTYYVNGQWADEGIGSEEIAPGDRIDWAYGSWDEASPPTADASPGA